MAAATKAVMVAAFLCILVTSSNAQSCTDWTQLLDCQGAASDPNATPTSGCCGKLKQYEGKPDCLCQLLMSAQSAAQSTGLAFNLQAALSIPSKCQLQVPSGYTCGGIVIPGN